MAQFAFQSPTVIDQEAVFVRRQPVGHLVELAVGNTDSHGDVPFDIFGFVWAGIDQHDALSHGNGDMLFHEGRIHDIVKGFEGRLADASIGAAACWVAHPVRAATRKRTANAEEMPRNDFIDTSNR
jgi:hypothetical protein